MNKIYARPASRKDNPALVQRLMFDGLPDMTENSEKEKDKWRDEHAGDERRNRYMCELLAARRTGRAANRVYGKVTL